METSRTQWHASGAGHTPPRPGGKESPHMNPRAEAFERLSGAYDVRVLEPSPPAVNRPPWFADDPTARGVVPPGRQLVSPLTTGDLLWDDLTGTDPGLADWCADRWL